ncbi:AAA family ATPase [Rhizobiaceae bacterium CRRU44]|uniref:AAA family ATPase n=1 Tax=Ferranicluibacter rubi TaxID=2715133 RepID=A0AA43ZDQ0_9HYPH|nr:AAA family ATPase [Ferranicluibacter rubi]NHT75894.1 AAA family ATPase [Ferranicluibacter rubi]NHT75954.1 AAA family ATPase [Ferranicluibacter rubi]
MNTFTDGVRDDTSLIIGVAGPSGSGKTVSALLLALGLAGDEPIAFIDTEGGRARHYFPTPFDTRPQSELLREFLFRVKYMDMRPPFSPKAIWLAINEAVDKVGARVVVIDSASDEWEGVGGLHDMHTAEMVRLAKKPYESFADWEMHKFNFPAWAVPKSEHKTHLMKNLRQVRAHVIFCFRAREVTKPVEIEDHNGRKKMTVQNIGWQPICEQNMLYDMTISFMVTPDAKGVPLMQNGEFYGKLNAPYAQFFQPGKQVSMETGRRLRAWARGENTNPVAQPAQTKPAADAGAEQTSQASAPNNSVLLAYHQALASEIDRESLMATHAREKVKLTEQYLVDIGKQILSAHNDRLKGHADADATNTYVTGLIEG